MWLSKELSYLMDKYLNEQVVLECDLVKLEKVKQLKKEFYAGREYLYNRLWVLILLHKWYKEKHC
jgi:asparagine synthase (glutamine-hydrolysing)